MGVTVCSLEVHIYLTEFAYRAPPLDYILIKRKVAECYFCEGDIL